MQVAAAKLPDYSGGAVPESHRSSLFTDGQELPAGHQRWETPSNVAAAPAIVKGVR
jgi:hypothetical protein